MQVSSIWWICYVLSPPQSLPWSGALHSAREQAEREQGDLHGLL